MRALPQVETKVVKNEMGVERRLYTVYSDATATSSYPKYNFGCHKFFYRFRLAYELLLKFGFCLYFFFSKIYLPGRITAPKKPRHLNLKFFSQVPPLPHKKNLRSKKKSGHTLFYFFPRQSVCEDWLQLLLLHILSQVYFSFLNPLYAQSFSGNQGSQNEQWAETRFLEDFSLPPSIGFRPLP